MNNFFESNINFKFLDIGSSISDFKTICELGKGAYGTVFKVESLKNSLIYVMKRIPLKHLKPRMQKEALQEVQILRKLSHPNIIQYYNSFIEEDTLNIVMEYASGGDLHSLMRKQREKKKYFSEKELWIFMYEICLGVDYLHSHNIIHRDIKCLNIFLSENKTIKIGDLGVSKIVSSSIALQGTRVGTPLYLSPELVKQLPYDYKIDIWAIGCVLYHLACLEPPFQGENLIVLGNNIVNKSPKPIPSSYSAKFIKFAEKLLTKKPSERPYIKEVLRLFPEIVKQWKEFATPVSQMSKETMKLVLPEEEHKKILPKLNSKKEIFEQEQKIRENKVIATDLKYAIIPLENSPPKDEMKQVIKEKEKIEISKKGPIKGEHNIPTLKAKIGSQSSVKPITALNNKEKNNEDKKDILPLNKNNENSVSHSRKVDIENNLLKNEKVVNIGSENNSISSDHLLNSRRNYKALTMGKPSRPGISFLKNFSDFPGFRPSTAIDLIPQNPQNIQNFVVDHEKEVVKDLSGKHHKQGIELKKIVPNRIIYRPQTAAYNFEFLPKKPIENNLEQKVVIQRLANSSYDSTKISTLIKIESGKVVVPTSIITGELQKKDTPTKNQNSQNNFNSPIRNDNTNIELDTNSKRPQTAGVMWRIHTCVNNKNQHKRLTIKDLCS